MASHFNYTTGTYKALLIVALVAVCSGEWSYEKIGASVATIPTDIPPNVTVVNLNKNDITVIPAFAFSKNTLLKVLDLSGNKITYIAAQAFTGCPIRTLKLYHNELSVSGLIGIHMLNQTLKTLNLYENPVDLSDELWFELLQNLSALQRLFVSRRPGDPRVTSPVIPASTRRQLIELHCSNAIETFPKELFSEMYNLKEFAVGNNALDDFPDFSLLPQNNTLRRCLLSSNNISFVALEDLERVPRLYKLYMRENKLQSFPDIREKKMSVLDLTSNPLVCDSRIAWMKQLQEHGGSLDLKLDFAPCSSPAHLVGVSWEDITYNDLVSVDDVLLDEDNSTCITILKGSNVLLRKVMLQPLRLTASLVNVSLIGQNIECWSQEQNRGLQFFVNSEEPDATKETCASSLLMKICRVVSSEPGLCHYICDCPAETGGCKDGRLFWEDPCSTSSDFQCLVCEVIK